MWGANHEAYAILADEVVGTGDSIALAAKGVPQLIEDAIYVCQRLSIPYLWVDIHCIHQKDAEVKAAEISVMGHIYHSSLITFVAAAGSTSAYLK